MSRFPRIILFFISVDWPIFMRKKMLYGLAEAAKEYGSTLIAVNRPLCPFTTIIRKPHRMQEYFEKPRIEKKADNLYLFSPRYFINDAISNRFDFLNDLNVKALRKAYRYVTSVLNLDESDPLIWYHHPQLSYLTGLFENSINIMEIYDSLSRFDGREIEFVNRLEEKYRTEIDLLLATSQKLLEKYGHHYSEAWLSGNGLDRTLYEKLVNEDVACLPDLVKIPSPRIGYTGIISNRLDWRLVSRIVRQKPEWSFIFVGNVAPSTPKDVIDQYPNAYFTGAYDHSLMPSVLKSFDLGFMPYKDNEFFRDSNPLKFYEFAAAGLRSVSSNMEILNKFDPEFVRIVPNDSADWISAITHMLQLDKDSARMIGRNIASEYIWEDMCRTILHKIDEKFFKE